jgi:hypothetical protein
MENSIPYCTEPQRQPFTLEIVQISTLISLEKILHHTRRRNQNKRQRRRQLKSTVYVDFQSMWKDVDDNLPKNIYLQVPVSQGEGAENLFEYCSSQWFPSIGGWDCQGLDLDSSLKEISKPNENLYP